MPAKFEYTPVAGDSPRYSNSASDEADDASQHFRFPPGRRQGLYRRWAHYLNITSHVLSWTLVLSLLYTNMVPRYWGWNRFQQGKLLPAQLTYSPAQDAIEYEVKVFGQGFESVPGGVPLEFTGPPSDRLDKAWSGLYNFGMSTISRTEASQLTNKTSIIPGQPENYVVQLDVFHQLHCLNRLRKGLNPYYFCPRDDPHCDDHREMAVGYDPSGEEADHMMHCLHSLRQSVMCHADIAPVVWHKSPHPRVDTGEYFNMGFLSTSHTCRNFDKVKQWAVERQMHGSFDTDIVPEDDGIEIPVYYGRG